MEKFQMIPMSANCVTLWLTVGDSSGSESERWNFEVFEQAQCFGTQWFGAQLRVPSASQAWNPETLEPWNRLR